MNDRGFRMAGFDCISASLPFAVTKGGPISL